MSRWMLAPAVFVASALLACRRDHAKAAPLVTTDAAPAAQTVRPDASTVEARVRSNFAVAVEDAEKLGIVHLANGAVVGLTYAEKSYLVTLAADGSIEPIASLLRSNTTGELVHVTGAWPGELTADFMF
jgi:CHAT domain-containing protein